MEQVCVSWGVQCERGVTVVAETHETVRVRLVRKLADRIDGVDISGNQVGDALTLPVREGLLLMAEQWAVPEGQHVRGGGSGKGRSRLS